MKKMIYSFIKKNDYYKIDSGGTTKQECNFRTHYGRLRKGASNAYL